MGHYSHRSSSHRGDSYSRHSHHSHSRSSSHFSKRDDRKRHRSHSSRRPSYDRYRKSRSRTPPSNKNRRLDSKPLEEINSKPNDATETKATAELTKQERLARFKKLAEERKIAAKNAEASGKPVTLKIAEAAKRVVYGSFAGFFTSKEKPANEPQAPETQEEVDDGVDPLDSYMEKLMMENEKELAEAQSEIQPPPKPEPIDESKVVTLDDILAWNNDIQEEAGEDIQGEFLERLQQKTKKDAKMALDQDDHFSDDELKDPIPEARNVDYYAELIEKIKNRRELPKVDHASMNYAPFNKNLYVQVSAITAMKEHEVEAFRRSNGNIRIRGKQCPRPIWSFAQCGLPDKILALLQKREYEKPFPIQMQCIPALMCGRDIIAIAETGSGKTLAFLLPLIRHVLDQPKLRENDGMIGLIIAPTRELVIQISNESSKLSKIVGLTTTAVYGGAAIGEQLNMLKRGTEIVCGTPGRLIDVLTISNGKVTNLKRTTFVVLDEADRMFDMGFSPQISAIVENIRPDRQTALFSATFPPNIENLAKQILTKPLQIIIGERGKSASQVDQHVWIVPESQKILALLKLLGEWHEHGSIIIFVNRQLDADGLFTELLKYGYECGVLHGGQDQTDREFTLQDFRDGTRTILIATSVAARGIDVKSVILVINYAAPDHFEDYVHRVGRTGRAGNIGTSYTFLTPEEGAKSHDVIRALTIANQPIPNDLSRMAQAHLMTINEKPKIKGGFGGKGFKFTESEKSRQQRERDSACKELGFDTREQEQEERQRELYEHGLTPVNPLQAPEVVKEGKDATKQQEKTNIVREPTPMIKGLSCAGWIDPNTGNVHDEFNINLFPESVRFKITNKDVLDRVSEIANVSLQVKGSYLPPEIAHRNLGIRLNTKGLYIEMVGPSIMNVQRALNELKMIVQTTSMNQLSMGMVQKSAGRYSVL
ncbi:bifunctional Helicase superfamily 1-2 [Babesia duncani]|uniref:RNA helicase n=1 Tax=Babesia duncani TaxID=323732 RepID=A0AAD9PKI1_9APIC|nr:bifunctional Helicase superfamily 1-2 [Babesia duncani]